MTREASKASATQLSLVACTNTWLHQLVIRVYQNLYTLQFENIIMFGKVFHLMEYHLSCQLSSEEKYDAKI